MTGWQRNTLSSALTLALLAAAPIVWAGTPPEGEDKGGGKEAEKPAPAEGDKPVEGEGEGAEKPKELPTPPPDLGGWGVGGKDDEGRFGPQGQTGKLKELEEEKKVETGEVPPNLPPPGYAYLDTVLGFGSVRVVTEPGEATEGTKVTPTASFLIGVGYRVGDTWSIGARFPISTGSVNGPDEPYWEGRRDPDAYKQIAIGGVELEVKPAFILSQTLRLPVGLAIVLPSGMGDYNPDPESRAGIGQAIVNQAATGSRGWEDRALFAHKRFGIVPSLGISLLDGPIEFDAATKVEIMIRTGGEDPVENHPLDASAAAAGVLQQRLRSVTYNWVTSAQFFYGIADGLFTPGARLWLAVANMGDYRENDGTEQVEGFTGVIPTGERDYSGVQLALEPQIKTKVPFTDEKNFGLDARLGYVIPLGMRLGGADDAFVSGLRIRAGMYF